MAAMAANALQLNKPKVAPTFADGDRISRWAKDAVEAAADSGILAGYPVRTMRPHDQATRAEAVMVFARIIKIIENR